MLVRKDSDRRRTKRMVPSTRWLGDPRQIDRIFDCTSLSLLPYCGATLIEALSF